MAARGGRLCRRCRRSRERHRPPLVEPTAPPLTLKTSAGTTLVPGHYSLSSCLSPAERGSIYEQLPGASARANDKTGGILRRFRKLFVGRKSKVAPAPPANVPHLYYEPVEWTAPSASVGGDSDYASSPVLLRSLRAARDRSTSDDSSDEFNHRSKSSHLVLRKWSSHDQVPVFSTSPPRNERPVTPVRQEIPPESSSQDLDAKSPVIKRGVEFQKGDTVNILEKKESGLLLGEVNGRLGYFQCVDLEEEGPRSLRLLLVDLRLEEYLDVLVRNGFDGPDTFMWLESEDLDLMRIWDPGHRRSLLEAARRLHHCQGCKPEDSGHSDSGVHSSSFESTYV